MNLTWNQHGDSLISQDVDYVIKDAKGRAIGGYAMITTWHDGTIALCTRSTRDGRTFGAIPRRTRCASVEQAKELAAKKLEAARRRYWHAWRAA